MSDDRQPKDCLDEVREVLRSDDEELSPGFYTRTVARFEAEHRPKARLPFGLTWSSAGLAAAVLLVAVVFIPLALREEIPLPAPETAVAEKADSPIVTGRELDDSTLQTEAVVETVAEAEAEEFAAAPPKQIKPRPVATDVADAIAEPVFAPVPEPAADLDAAAGDPANEERQEEWVDEGRRDASLSVARAQAVAPPPPAEKKSALAVGGARAKEYRPVAVTLADDLVPAGEVALLYQLEDDEGAVRMPAMSSMIDTAGLIAPHRFVAVGRRPGLDTCAALELSATDAGWEITYAVSDSTPGSVSCGIKVPDDGRAILFLGEPIGE